MVLALGFGNGNSRLWKEIGFDWMAHRFRSATGTYLKKVEGFLNGHSFTEQKKERHQFRFWRLLQILEKKQKFDPIKIWSQNLHQNQRLPSIFRFCHIMFLLLLKPALPQKGRKIRSQVSNHSKSCFLVPSSKFMFHS